MATLLTTETRFGFGIVGSYTDIARVLNITPPATEVVKVATGLNAADVRQSIPGIVNNISDVIVTMEFDATEYGTLLGMVGTNPCYFRLTYRDTTYDYFTGYIFKVTKGAIDSDNDTVMTAEVSIAVTSEVVQTSQVPALSSSSAG